MIVSEPSLILLIGPTGSGKTTFARKHFRETEIVSSDRCRALVCDDENAQWASGPAFELLRLIVLSRLRFRRLTVIDATNSLSAQRRPYLRIAADLGIPAVAVLFDLPEELCMARNAARTERSLPQEIVGKQWRQVRESAGNLPKEGYASIFILSSEDEVEGSMIRRL